MLIHMQMKYSNLKLLDKAKIFPKMFFNLCLQFQILLPNFQCNFIQKNEA
jgi:hypothetical protein